MKKLIILLISSLYMSCGLFYSNVAVEYKTVANSSRNITTKSIAEIDSVYSTYGNLVAIDGQSSLTPMSFIISVRGFILSNAGTQIYMAPAFLEESTTAAQQAKLHVDFCEPIDEGLYHIYTMQKGTFSDFEFDLTSSTRDLNNNLIENPRVTVRVAGYTDTEWPDITTEIYNQTIYTRKYLGSNTFEISFSHIYPLTYVEYFHFSNSITSAKIESNPEVGSFETLYLPFNSISINEDCKLVISLDHEGILAVFDNFTPGDKSDDVIKLVNGFWNRFTVSTENL